MKAKKKLRNNRVASDDGLCPKPATSLCRRLLAMRNQYIKEGGELLTADQILAILSDGKVHRRGPE